MEKLVRVLKSHREKLLQHPGEVELEFRLGSMSGEEFCPGIQKEIFDQLESDLIDSPQLTPDKVWREFVDYYYTDANGETNRTRVSFDPESMEVGKEHIRKVPFEKLIVRNAENAEEVCRISMAREIPVTTPPNVCVPTYVRIQQRRAFHDVRENNEVWSYELSKTWSGNSKKVVEKKQQVCEPVYEMECEFRDNNLSYTNTRTVEEMAESMLLKIKLLIGENLDADLVVLDEKEKRKRKRSCKKS